VASAYSQLTFEQKRAIYLAQQEGDGFLERARIARLVNMNEADVRRDISAIFGRCPLPPMRKSSGLVEQQQWFHRKK
jgi:hypothetical protein